MTGVGQRFGRYRLDRVLGRGGMGVVHAAHDTVLDREVALKLVAPHLADDEGFRARFGQEAAVLAKLDSHRIVRIFDHGTHAGTLFIATQLVEGGDLQRLVAEQGALAPALAVEVVGQVLEGLEAAHAVGVVHRDIKPANVLLRQRQGEVEAFLCDFGIAATAGSGFTQTGGVAGSLPYLAPERHEGRDATPASDVYAVGCLLWAALTGTAPYVGTDADVLFGHLYGAVPKLPGRDDFSKRMNPVLAKALAKDPRRRYPTAKAMLAALRPLTEGAPGAIALPGATAIRRPVVVRRRRWLPAVLAVGGVLAVVAGGVAVASLGQGEERATRPTPGAVTMTERVRGLDLGPSRTLSPAAVTSTQADGDVVVLGAPPQAMGEPPVVGVDPPPAGGPAGAPKQAAPVPTRAAPAPKPQPRYRCWDSATHVEDDLADCGTPTGVAGGRWLADGFDARGCARYRADDARWLESFRCRWDGDRGVIFLVRFSSTAAARTGLDQRIWESTRQPWTEWSPGGQQAKGAVTSGGARSYRHVAYWSVPGQTWGVLVTHPDKPTRDRGMATLGGLRPSSGFRGHRLS